MTSSNPQTSMDETDLTSEHESITAAASEWQAQDHELRRLAKTAGTLKKRVVALVVALELPDGKYRFGPVTVSIKQTTVEHREFDVGGERQLRFSSGALPKS